MTYLGPELELNQVFQPHSRSFLFHSFTLGRVAETEEKTMCKTEFRFSGNWHVVDTTRGDRGRVLEADSLTFETRLHHLPVISAWQAVGKPR